MHAFQYHAQLSVTFSVLTVIAIELSATRADTVLSSPCLGWRDVTPCGARVEF